MITTERAVLQNGGRKEKGMVGGKSTGNVENWKDAGKCVQRVGCY